MSIPRDLSLRETPQGLRLVQTPAALIRNNLDNLSHHRVTEAKNVAIHTQKWKAMPGNSYWIEADITVDAGANAGFLLAAKDSTTGTRIGYDATHHQLFVDRSHAGGGKIKTGREVQTIDMGTTGLAGSAVPARKTLHLEILVDRSSLEVFADHGLYALSTQIFPDEDANSIYLFSNGGNAVINSIKIWDLSPVH